MFYSIELNNTEFIIIFFSFVILIKFLAITKDPVYFEGIHISLLIF